MSSHPEIGWESLLSTDAPENCKLTSALFTTYDRADARLLVEHLLPVLLRTEKEPESEGLERQYYLLELHEKLERLHDRLVIVSSEQREEPFADEGHVDVAAYGWIWRHIRNLVVGRDGKAIQHAKLWMLHWTSVDGPDYLEIVVSSANLTRAAFQGQLQAVWRACLELQPRTSNARTADWSVLPDFLRALAHSCGHPKRFDAFIALLSRAECPAGVTFVASVPGDHSKGTLSRTPWGAADLTKIAPAGRGAVSVSVLAPYVGAWSTDSLKAWCLKFEGTPSKLELLWLDRDHPWADYWLLPATTLRSLQSEKVSLSRLCHYADPNAEFAPFHAEHHRADPRWSHAKLYRFRRGRSQRVLVTSANFSMAAWGTPGPNGSLSIENFELGVCLDQVDWPFDGLGPLGSNASTTPALPPRETSRISWADASWDGSKIQIECRSPLKFKVQAVLRVGAEVLACPNWESTKQNPSLRRASVAWRKPWASPFVIELTCEGEKLVVPIFDARPHAERESTLPAEIEVNVDTAQIMRDRLLFELYGGRVTDLDDPTLGDPDSAGEAEDLENENSGGVNHADSYAVPAFVLARQHFEVVDNWAKAARQANLACAHTDERIVVIRDGERLAEAFSRQADRERQLGTGARLASEEITFRLKLFRSA